MAYYFTKILLSAVMIVLVSELAKRHSFAGAVIASIPLISVLAFVWVYIETKDTDAIITLSQQILWLVPPSLLLFISLPWLLRQHVSFALSLSLSIALTASAYLAILWLTKKF